MPLAKAEAPNSVLNSRADDQYVGPGTSTSPKPAITAPQPIVVAQSYLIAPYVSTEPISASVDKTVLSEYPSFARSEITEYIETLWKEKTQEAITVFTCESGLNPMAFNPETYAKAKGITKYSSCGIVQNNDPRCDDKTSQLYDWKYSIDLGYKKYLERGWQPWRNCAKKFGII
jgi:hypothetical protein